MTPGQCGPTHTLKALNVLLYLENLFGRPSKDGPFGDSDYRARLTVDILKSGILRAGMDVRVK
jgi:hypothetical protein